MQTDAHPIAHFVTQVVGIDGNHEPLEIEVFIRRGTNSAAHKEEPVAQQAGRKSSPYVHAFTTNLSDANKRGLDNLAYWSYGFRRSKTYLLNQALVQYLAQYKESQRPPLEEG